VQFRDGKCYPRIRGSAFITGEATLVLDPCDPFVHGISPHVPDTYDQRRHYRRSRNRRARRVRGRWLATGCA